jgi:outer membrane protein assembly factor BamD
MLITFVGCGKRMVVPVEMAPLTAMSKAKDEISNEDYSKARDYLYHITSFYPGNDLADDAQYLLGETFYTQEKYESAIVEYEMVISRYPNSEFVDNAYLMMGFSYLELSPSFYLDQDMTKKAIVYFDEVINEYPMSECVNDAKEGKLRAREKLAKKVFKAGKFYYDREKFKSAIIYFEEVISEYKDTMFYEDSLFYYGRALKKNGDDKKAIEIFRTLEEQFPESKYSEDIKEELEDLT